MKGVQIRKDQKRGCGWRKEGGLYLVSGKLSSPCRKLPLFLERCPCCDQGVKPTRGWTWIGFKKLMESVNCGNTNPPDDTDRCLTCPCSRQRAPERAGLLWIGGAFYESPELFTKEAAQLGISRRISAIPKGFKVGETLVAIAHRAQRTGKVTDGKAETKPAIFNVFLPTAIEYIVKPTDTQERIDDLIKRGVTPVRVERVGEQMEMEEPDPMAHYNQC